MKTTTTLSPVERFQQTAVEVTRQIEDIADAIRKKGDEINDVMQAPRPAREVHTEYQNLISAKIAEFKRLIQLDAAERFRPNGHQTSRSEPLYGWSEGKYKIRDCALYFFHEAQLRELVAETVESVNHRHPPVTEAERAEKLEKLSAEKKELEESQKKIIETLSLFNRPELSVTNPKTSSNSVMVQV
jgi:vacuolar-type H+-ATPase subunit I/STV1